MSRARAVEKTVKIERKNRPSDFSDEYLGISVKINVDENIFEGRILEASRYWFKILLGDGRIIYVNKAYVKYLEPVGVKVSSQDTARKT